MLAHKKASQPGTMIVISFQELIHGLRMGLFNSIMSDWHKYLSAGKPTPGKIFYFNEEVRFILDVNEETPYAIQSNKYAMLTDVGSISNWITYQCLKDPDILRGFDLSATINKWMAESLTHKETMLKNLRNEQAEFIKGMLYSPEFLATRVDAIINQVQSYKPCNSREQMLGCMEVVDQITTFNDFSYLFARVDKVTLGHR